MRISTIAVSQLGKTLDRGKDIGQECPYLCSINVYYDGIDLSKVKRFKLRDDELSRYRLQRGDLLICEGGDYGRCCVWDREEEMYYQNALHRVRFYCGLLPTFYKYVFELYRKIGYIVGQGQTIKHFTYESMKSLMFPLPPIEDQHRIVSKIEELLPLINRYDSSQCELDELNCSIQTRLKKSILQEAIQGKLVPQNPDDEPGSVLLERIKAEKAKLFQAGKLKKKDLADSVIFKGEDNKYYEQVENSISDITSEIPFDIPESWAWCRMGSLTNLRIGKTPARGDSSFWQQGIHPWVSISDLTQNNIINSTKEKISDIAAQTIMGPISKAGSLLMSFKLTVGKTGILTIDAYHNEAIVTINTFIDNDFHTRNYLSIILPILTNYGETKDAIKGKTMNSQSLNALLIPLPPIDEQKRIFQKVSLLFSKLTC